MSFRQRTNWFEGLFSPRRSELGFNGLWLAMVCALLLAAPVSAGNKAAPLPGFSISRLSSVAHQTGNDYTVVLWWLQQAQAAQQSTSNAVPPHSSVISALCERTADNSSGHFVSAFDEDSRQLINRLSSAHALADESTFTPEYPSLATLRLDDSRKLLVLTLAPHEALMRSGTSYCRFDE